MDPDDTYTVRLIRVEGEGFRYYRSIMTDDDFRFQTWNAEYLNRAGLDSRVTGVMMLSRSRPCILRIRITP